MTALFNSRKGLSGYGIWTFTNFQNLINLAVNFSVPSLLSKPGCNFNTDSVSS